MSLRNDEGGTTRGFIQYHTCCDAGKDQHKSRTPSQHGFWSFPRRLLFFFSSLPFLQGRWAMRSGMQRSFLAIVSLAVLYRVTEGVHQAYACTPHRGEHVIRRSSPYYSCSNAYELVVDSYYNKSMHTLVI